MAIGILSIASLIPAAKSLIRDANHSDQSASVGLSALADVRNHAYLAAADAEPWTDANNDGIADAGEFTDTNGDGVYNAFPYGVVLDPLFLANPSNAANPDVAAMASFPYISPIGGTGPYGTSPFQRTTPFPFAAAVGGAQAAENLAARLFGSQHAVAFSSPDDPTLRPTRIYQPGQDSGWGVAGTDDDGDGATDEPDEGGWLNSDDTAQLAPEYTWLAAVMPDQVVDDATTAVVEGTPDSYRVSVAVFYRRDTLLPTAGAEPDVPDERMIYADILGGGLSGGDFRLRADTATNSDQLKVRPNDWIALIGWRAGSAATPSVSIPGGTTGRNVPFLFWYRVLGAGDIDPAYDVAGTSYLGRDVTLAGPDLIYQFPDGTTIAGSAVDNDDDPATDPVAYDADADAANGMTFQAVLFSNCVGVFERTIRND